MQGIEIHLGVSDAAPLLGPPSAPCSYCMYVGFMSESTKITRNTRSYTERIGHRWRFQHESILKLQDLNHIGNWKIISETWDLPILAQCHNTRSPFRAFDSRWKVQSSQVDYKVLNGMQIDTQQLSRRHPVYCLDNSQYQMHNKMIWSSWRDAQVHGLSLRNTSKKAKRVDCGNNRISGIS